MLPKVYERHAVLAISVSLEKSSLNPLSYVLNLFWQFFSSPMRTWSTWYLIFLRKVCALSQVNVFFRTLARSSVHSLDASSHLTELCRRTPKKPRRASPVWPCDCVTHQDSCGSYKILLFPHTQVFEFSRLDFLGVFLSCPQVTGVFVVVDTHKELNLAQELPLCAREVGGRVRSKREHVQSWPFSQDGQGLAGAWGGQWLLYDCHCLVW